MKVKELIEILQKANPEDVVCTFQEGGPEEVDRLDVYEGRYQIYSQKMAVFHHTGIYVGVGCPGNFDATMYEDDCKLVKELQ